MEDIFMEIFKVSPVIAILGAMYYYQRKDYTKLVEDTRKESKEREVQLQKTSDEREGKMQVMINKCQDIIADLARKFDVVEEVKVKVEDIEKEITKISERIDRK